MPSRRISIPGLGDQDLLGAGATVGADQGFPHLALEIAQVGEVDQLVHQRKAPGDGLVDLGGRLTADGLMPWQSVSGPPVWQGPCAGWLLLVRKRTVAEAAR